MFLTINTCFSFKNSIFEKWQNEKNTPGCISARIFKFLYFRKSKFFLAFYVASEMALSLFEQDELEDSKESFLNAQSVLKLCVPAVYLYPKPVELRGRWHYSFREGSKNDGKNEHKKKAIHHLQTRLSFPDEMWKFWNVAILESYVLKVKTLHWRVDRV